MKILHICLASFYIDNFSYQENLLPKYHKKQGMEVEILASLETFDSNGNIDYLSNPNQYINEHGIPVKRLAYKDTRLSRKLRLYKETYSSLVQSNPDIIFIHGCQFVDIKQVVRYLKENPEVIVYVDNHADFSNSARNWVSKNILHKIIWRSCAYMIEPYTKKFYGVLPSRVDFLVDVYKVPKKKVDLLVMGVDDEKVLLSQNASLKSEIREKYNVNPEDFLIVTGGKIDNAKRQILLLLEAVKEINDERVKLLMFGSVINEMKDEVNALVDGVKIQYIGWVNAEDSYKYFASADLAIFPGRHSVFWEEVVGLGTPIVVKYWEGTTHIDVGGNCVFLYNDSVNEIQEVIIKLLENPSSYETMKSTAKNGKKLFSYENIARKSIEETIS